MEKMNYLMVFVLLFGACVCQCPQGSYTGSPPSFDTTKAQCKTCQEVCKTCTSATVCDSFIDGIDGIDTSTNPPSVICYNTGARIEGATYGYDKSKDSCGRCAEGCSKCRVDYDYCTQCVTGYDLDVSGKRCVRATLGLAAVVFALSVIALIFGVMTCICSCKL